MSNPIEALIPLVAILAVFGSPVAIVWLGLRHRQQMARLKVEQLEAERRLAEAKQLGALPEYIDRDDPVAVRAYQEAQAELARTAGRAAALTAARARG
ncbi:MAG: hypothetical protein JNM72_15515 [Deltaproteobacteria bacterium]|jgi:hypothetical protein|nr:hypothetical protein [Deltaproteobacteria bacterium]